MCILRELPVLEAEKHLLCIVSEKMRLKKGSDCFNVAYAGNSQLDTLHVTMFNLLEEEIYQDVFRDLVVA